MMARSEVLHQLPCVLLLYLSLEHCIGFFQGAEMDMNKFLRMTEPQDFANIGIREPRECDRLSLCVQSLRTHLAQNGYDHFISSFISSSSSSYYSVIDSSPSNSRPSSSTCPSTLSTPSDVTPSDIDWCMDEEAHRQAVCRAIDAFDRYMASSTSPVVTQPVTVTTEPKANRQSMVSFDLPSDDIVSSESKSKPCSSPVLSIPSENTASAATVMTTVSSKPMIMMTTVAEEGEEGGMLDMSSENPPPYLSPSPAPLTQQQQQQQQTQQQQQSPPPLPPQQQQQQQGTLLSRIGKPGTVIPRPRKLNLRIPRPLSMPIHIMMDSLHDDDENDQSELASHRNSMATATTVTPATNPNTTIPLRARPVSYAAPEPPDYHEMALIKRWEKCRSCILPREEEGREELPPYQCTVYKMGHVYIKREMDSPGLKTRWRRWRKLYVELWGTILRIYRTAPNEANNNRRLSSRFPFHFRWNRYYYTPLMTISLAGAEAIRAYDYTKRPNSLRLITAHGPQLLLRLNTGVEMISWVEHLQAAINISLDLEYRPMPKFITLPGRGVTAHLTDARSIQIERARQQRQREQREMLI
ncbi:uncharacterized protein BYT42DRAFT_562991 [Radiomyces spectabilis]|uniref:uncharacterized protein n=1 Tax=Radiomyces spectabilis TaxID=64574 RepID=UPI00221F0079|nr:uncharacterized protein BYT42DRAFT_562991 [Radiomyces spectabilis]KAI8384585.1 hypothetical protein BYT42DRAFT_562991 [Radiomyces spectabilis]